MKEMELDKDMKALDWERIGRNAWMSSNHKWALCETGIGQHAVLYQPTTRNIDFDFFVEENVYAPCYSAKRLNSYSEVETDQLIAKREKEQATSNEKRAFGVFVDPRSFMDPYVYKITESQKGAMVLAYRLVSNPAQFGGYLSTATNALSISPNIMTDLEHAQRMGTRISNGEDHGIPPIEFEITERDFDSLVGHKDYDAFTECIYTLERAARELTYEGITRQNIYMPIDSRYSFNRKDTLQSKGLIDRLERASRISEKTAQENRQKRKSRGGTRE